MTSSAPPLTESEFLEAQRRRLSHPRHMPPLTGAWAAELVRLLNAKQLGAPPLPSDFSAAEVVDTVIDVNPRRVSTLFYVIDAACKAAPPADPAQWRWANELTCLAAVKSLDLQQWQSLARRAAGPGSQHGHSVVVPTSSALVAALGLSQLMGLRFTWGAHAAERAAIDLSDSVATSNPTNAVLVALADELTRLRGQPIHPDADRTMSEDDIGWLRHQMDQRREEGQFTAIFLRCPDSLGEDNITTLVDRLMQALNTTVIQGQPSHDDQLVRPHNQLTVASLKAKLDEAFATLAPFIPKSADTHPPASEPAPAPPKPAPQRTAMAPASWDIFISHASEDKPDFVVPLARGLETVGLRVWLDAQEIAVGDSIVGKLNQGLAESRFAVVVLSPAYLRKGRWVEAELQALLATEIQSGRKRLLPLCKDISVADVQQRFPLLGDKLLLSTERGLSAVISAILTASQADR